ncbi:hypothetical protein D9M68_922410 [compost metagenome]
MQRAAQPELHAQAQDIDTHQQRRSTQGVRQVGVAGVWLTHGGKHLADVAGWPDCLVQQADYPGQQRQAQGQRQQDD